MAAFINYGDSHLDATNMTYTTSTSAGSSLTFEQMRNAHNAINWNYVAGDTLDGFKQWDRWEEPKVNFPFRNPNYLKTLLIPEQTLLFEGE